MADKTLAKNDADNVTAGKPDSDDRRIFMTTRFERPFPALTPAQRFHFEVHGYVVVPGVLSEEECGLIREALQRTKRDIRARATNHQLQPGEAHFIVDLPHHVFMGSIREADPVFAAYAAHPRLVGMAEEVIGGEARIVELNAHVNSRNPAEKFDVAPQFGFHLGIDVPYGTHVKNGLFHCSFVKTLTNLTELGPDDGGTVVIAGSHKLDAPEAQAIACAYEDRSLIHQVIAPAGSTLLFAETLVHATGQIRSDRERAIIVCGYGTTMFPYWDGGDMTPEFAAQIPEHLKALFCGKAHWTRGPRYRTLADPVDPRRFILADAWHPVKK
jgi:ectoine hydroxylase-related dioxygenase (phytanoyl-CoA dioxygenase family)